MNIANLSRRRFLQSSGIFVVGAAVPGCSVGPMPSPDATLEPNVFLSLAGDGTVTITASRSEMGQGIRTALAQIVADELEADWSRVTVVQAVGDPVYGDQNTDGSQSIRFLFDTLRNAGASAREMLRMAAANQWGVPVAETEAADHSVTHAASGRSLAYGDLVAAASELPVPENPPFKTRDAYRYIGKTRVHVDASDVADGRATFGLDVTLPDMAHAVVVRPPSLGSAVASFEPPADEPGLIAVETLPGVSGLGGMFNPVGGVAIVADRTWTAIRIARDLEVQWTEGPNAAFDSGEFTRQLRERVQTDGERLFDSGDLDAAFAAEGTEVEALYETPFLSHAPMEPPCALASVTEGRCEVWAPVQDPQSTRGLVAGWLGLDTANVTIHVTLLGGAFGRKSKPDFVLEAVELSKRLGRPGAGDVDARGRHRARLLPRGERPVSQGEARWGGPPVGLAATHGLSDHRHDVRRVGGAAGGLGTGDGILQPALPRREPALRIQRHPARRPDRVAAQRVQHLPLVLEQYLHR